MSISSANGTTFVSGPDVLQVSDFYVHAGILYPLAVGSIAVLFLFTWLRLGSNRCIAPITIFDWVINVALGSTVAGIVNGNSLVRGLLALSTMLSFQYAISTFTARFRKLSWLRQAKVLNVCLVECGIIGPNGTITVFTMKQLRDAEVEPEVLNTVPMYKKLCKMCGDLAAQVDRCDSGSSEGSNKGDFYEV